MASTLPSTLPDGGGADQNSARLVGCEFDETLPVSHSNDALVAVLEIHGEMSPVVAGMLALLMRNCGKLVGHVELLTAGPPRPFVDRSRPGLPIPGTIFLSVCTLEHRRPDREAG